VPGVNSLSKKTSSATGARNGPSRLATRYMRKTAFWNIFDGVNRHSSCGDRVAKVTAGQPSYRRLFGEVASSIRENNKDVETARQCIGARLSTKCSSRRHPEKQTNSQTSRTIHRLNVAPQFTSRALLFHNLSILVHVFHWCVWLDQVL